ncbi:dihydrofolate reductase family protein [Streptomyces griseorubiginosus]|uniref:dihydrofolate reductase family protein n=1 Tax=Streptomyces griseorubiginosus TaxID=67304 RepID=UPI003646C769
MRNPIRLYMSMPLDDHIAGPDDRPGQELGRDGGRLFNWLDDRNPDGPSGQVYREALATGALISGGTSPSSTWWVRTRIGTPSWWSPCRRRASSKVRRPGHARFVTDVDDCAHQARTAAGDRPVMVHGASAAQALLRAGHLDEMEIHLIPVLLGEGRRLFDHLGTGHIELDLVRRLDDRDVTHLPYRVHRSEGSA